MSDEGWLGPEETYRWSEAEMDRHLKRIRDAQMAAAIDRFLEPLTFVTMGDEGPEVTVVDVNADIRAGLAARRSARGEAPSDP